MSKFINIDDNDILPEEISVIGKVKTFSTGNLSCDWDFGFNIFLKGGQTLKILTPTKIDSRGNHLMKREERMVFANEVRDSVLNELQNG